MKKSLFKTLSTTQSILLGFVCVIFTGSMLLALPVSSATGNAVPYLDALFTATTATCVTGLVTLPVYSTWSGFGQVVILILIQIGGLGVITVMSGVMISLHKRLGLKDRLLMQDAFNLNSISGIVQFTKKVLVGTFVVEGIGALLYMPVLIPEFGVKGIWISVFTSVSAFCNAGIDLLSDNSLCGYALNPLMNFTTCMLIIVGGLGYIVWWDVLRVMKKFRQLKMKCFRHLTLHSKIALSVTLLLLVCGTAAMFVFEFNNPLTIGNFSFSGKMQAAFFQSVTTRTAGFATIPQQSLTNPSVMVCLLLMLIGGSPAGTAGGIKTVTFAVLLVSMISTIQNKNEVDLFQRSISKQTVEKAVAVTGMSFLIVFVSTVLLSAVTNADALDIIYETVSAAATVGLTRNLTPLLNEAGKVILIVTMYLGRVGPISLAVALNTKKKTVNIIKNPTEEISVG